MFRQSAGALAATGLLIGCSSAGAAIIYGNGFINGNLGGIEIAGGYAVSDSFILKGGSFVLNTIDFGAWTLSGTGDTLATVDWGITTTPNSFSGFLASGSAAAVTDGPTTPNGYGYNFGVDSISVGNINLASGTYYLVLQNAVVASHDGDAVMWDVSNGVSTAVSNLLGSLQGAFGAPNTTGSESFALLGQFPNGETPEPATWLLMLVGVAGLGVSLRRARRLGGARAG